MHSLKPWYVFTDNSKDVAPGISFQLFISNPSCPNPGRREKIKLNFYFRTSLCYFYFNTTFRNARDVKGKLPLTVTV